MKTKKTIASAIWAAALSFCLISAANAYAQNLSNIPLKLGKVAESFQRPVAIVFHPVLADQMYVVEQFGLIKMVKDEQSQTVLDLSEVVRRNANEAGLLSMVFHPNFRENRRIFLNYTLLNGRRHFTRVAEFVMDKNGLIQKDSEKVLLEILQVASNHNGGNIAFGPDGFLYIGMGDGGFGGDPQGHGQNLNSLLGKMLRIDVDGEAPYAIPADNPQFEEQGARPEIFAYGLRNPWRFSFDRQTGSLWAADVGQGAQEEIDIIVNGGNYGWNIMEGNLCFNPRTDCNRRGLETPITVYTRDQGVSVTGGYVYRGGAIPQLNGTYLFADYVSGNVWGLKHDGQEVVEHEKLLTVGLNISTFGEDLNGEIYVADHGGGGIYRLKLNQQ